MFQKVPMPMVDLPQARMSNLLQKLLACSFFSLLCNGTEAIQVIKMAFLTHAQINLFMTEQSA
jgi:hypothetical protein